MTVKLVFMQTNTWSLEIRNNINPFKTEINWSVYQTTFFVKTLHVSAERSAINRLKYIDDKK